MIKCEVLKMSSVHILREKKERENHFCIHLTKFNYCCPCFLFQLSEQEVETVLDKCMVLFRFLQEKVTVVHSFYLLMHYAQ